ncbi:uncharacterized protein MELLADRAFT_85517 [Melampsora larici-populina 98AG31]|uniref:Uncharacterized protein n=1 Tax=Melampsora larici-populina (strain 98AG31 / pathotype 3-4-7) TaxID=747676 RepID=F4RJ01_MELLP|nr:uncharacterized protein MELLADRAFT_85517 [Melampsora larici-populina 98AG31]EGG07649.1 hypothetical protein MELLADRAFT_85517 [Melampsora larici-populina 98AG31]
MLRLRFSESDNRGPRPFVAKHSNVTSLRQRAPHEYVTTICHQHRLDSSSIVIRTAVSTGQATLLYQSGESNFQHFHFTTVYCCASFNDSSCNRTGRIIVYQKPNSRIILGHVSRIRRPIFHVYKASCT